MNNPFCLSDTKLKILLDAYTAWCDKDEQEKSYPVRERKKAEELKDTFLTKSGLPGMTNDELAKKIFDYSRTLEGPAFIRLGMDRITSKVNNLRSVLVYLMDSPDDPFQKAEKVLEGEYKIPIFAKAFWSPIFQAR